MCLRRDGGQWSDKDLSSPVFTSPTHPYLRVSDGVLCRLQSDPRVGWKGESFVHRSQSRDSIRHRIVYGMSNNFSTLLRYVH